MTTMHLCDLYLYEFRPSITKLLGTGTKHLQMYLISNFSKIGLPPLHRLVKRKVDAEQTV